MTKFGRKYNPRRCDVCGRMANDISDLKPYTRRPDNPENGLFQHRLSCYKQSCNEELQEWATAPPAAS